MKYLIILSTIIFLSCEKENKNVKSESQYEVTYRIIIKENEKYNSYLSENIKTKIRDKSIDKNVKTYDSLTAEYLYFLTELEAKINKNTSEILFAKDKYSSEGKDYINKTKSYKSEIEKLSKSINFKKRVNLVLNTNDVQIPKNPNLIAEINEDGKALTNKLYVPYLDYYFKGYTKTQSLAFINNKKRSVLELENEFIASSEK